MVEKKEISDVVEKESEKYGWRNKIKDFVLDQPITTILLSLGMSVSGIYIYASYLASEERRTNPLTLGLVGLGFFLGALSLGYIERGIVKKRYDLYKDTINKKGVEDGWMLKRCLEHRSAYRMVNRIAIEEGLKGEFDEAYNKFIKEETEKQRTQ